MLGFGAAHVHAALSVQNRAYEFVKELVTAFFYIEDSLAIQELWRLDHDLAERFEAIKMPEDVLKLPNVAHHPAHAFAVARTMNIFARLRDAVAVRDV